MVYKSILCLSLISLPLLFGLNKQPNTTAVVTLVGAHIKCRHILTDKKTKRADCKICLGQGWYWSGDKIKKIECQYCE